MAASTDARPARPDREELARAWWPYCAAWAARMGSLHPGHDYEDAANWGLYRAILGFSGRGETLSREYLDRHLMLAGRDATRTARRRAARLAARPLREPWEGRSNDGEDDACAAIDPGPARAEAAIDAAVYRARLGALAGSADPGERAAAEAFRRIRLEDEPGVAVARSLRCARSHAYALAARAARRIAGRDADD